MSMENGFRSGIQNQVISFLGTSLDFKLQIMLDSNSWSPDEDISKICGFRIFNFKTEYIIWSSTGMSKRLSTKQGFLKFSFLLFILLIWLKTLNSDFTYEFKFMPNNTEYIDYGELKAKEMCEERGLHFDRFDGHNETYVEISQNYEIETVYTDKFLKESTICISTIEGFECSIISCTAVGLQPRKKFYVNT